MKFKESQLAHRLLDGLEGIEIGGSAHNPFGLKARNVDYTAEFTTFKQEEVKLCGEALPVDIVSPGDELPLRDHSVDFVISSHVIEHFPDPIKTLKEWHRVVRPGGYLFIIAPHKDRTFDRQRPRTTLAELIERHETGRKPEVINDHCSVWITEDLVELIRWLGWPIAEVQDVDDKVGNGFTIVVRVEKQRAPILAGARPLWAHPWMLAPVPVPSAPAAPPPVRAKPAAPAAPPPVPEIAFGMSDPSRPQYVQIGAHSYYVPRETRLLGYAPGEQILIGKYCSIARDVTIIVGGNHTTETVSTYPFDTWFLGRMNPTRSYRQTRNTEIGSDVWIGDGAFIASGVRIGHGAVVASRAAVFTDVPPYAIAAGNPARVNKYRFSEEIVEGLLRIAWWDWPEAMVRRNVEWFYRPVAEFVKQFDPGRPNSEDLTALQAHAGEPTEGQAVTL